MKWVKDELETNSRHGLRQGVMESDLDLLVSFEDPPGLLKLIEMENYLSDLLGIKVDLVMRESLKSGIGERILKEVIPV